MLICWQLCQIWFKSNLTNQRHCKGNSPKYAFSFYSQIHSFSAFQIPKDNKHLLPSPNGQGQRVHSSSWNWLTQGHSWNIGGEGVHVVEISVTPKTDLKRPVTGLAPVTDAGPCQLNPHGCQSNWGRVLLPAVTGNICRHTWIRNVKWESAGRTGMFTLLANHKGKPSLMHVFNAIPGRKSFYLVHNHAHCALSMHNYGYNLSMTTRQHPKQHLIGVCNQKIHLFCSFVLIENLICMTSVIDAGMFW